MSENTMFPGEDGYPTPNGHPQLTPTMAHAEVQMTATEVNKRLPWPIDPDGPRPLYTPPERCWGSAKVDYIEPPHGRLYAGAPVPTPYLGLTTDAAERKKLQLWTFLTEYFPDAFLAVLDVSIKGNDQHNPGQPLHWAREKSTDQMNTAMRHMWDDARGSSRDTDGCWHLAKAIWRLSAQLQLKIEAKRNGVK